MQLSQYSIWLVGSVHPLRGRPGQHSAVRAVGDQQLVSKQRPLGYALEADLADRVVVLLLLPSCIGNGLCLCLRHRGAIRSIRRGCASLRCCTGGRVGGRCIIIYSAAGTCAVPYRTPGIVRCTVLSTRVHVCTGRILQYYYTYMYNRDIRLIRLWHLERHHRGMRPLDASEGLLRLQPVELTRPEARLHSLSRLRSTASQFPHAA